MTEHSRNKIRKGALLGLSTLILAACGGGGGSSPAPTPPTPVQPPVSNTPTWEAGVYAPASELIARCETPRTGIDPFTGEAYPDVAGSALIEKLWMRSFTDETYLWFDEVPDNNPDNFTVLGYFDQLKTTELTASGKPKDNFHFTQPTDEYNERTQSGTSSGYGISWEFVENRAPREFIVRFTEPGSPAAQAQVPRGASLRFIDGIDFVNTDDASEIDIINAALFPADVGSTYNFTFELIDGSNLDVTLSSQVIDLKPVQNAQVLETEAGRVGYFQFNSFISPSQGDLIDAFQSFVDEPVTDLVIDLRYNGGGLLALASQIGYMVAGPNQTNNAIFDRLIFNSKREQLDPIPFYTREIDYENGVFTNNSLPSPELTRVFVLTTDNTCSASESVINGLRGIDVEVIQIGGTTCGKPFGFVPQDNCGTTYFTIQSQGVNDKGFGDYTNGFSAVASPVFDDELPGCDVPDDLSKPLGDPSEGMLAAAIQYASTGTCPETTSSSASENIEVERSGPAIRTPNPYLEAILADDRRVIDK